MKGSICKVLGVLLVGACLLAAQPGWAKEDLDCDISVSGVVCAIDPAANSIDVCSDDSSVTVYGIPLSYLDKWEVLEIEDGLEVTINAHQCPSFGTLMACDITPADGDLIELRQGIGQNGSLGEK